MGPERVSAVLISSADGGKVRWRPSRTAVLWRERRQSANGHHEGATVNEERRNPWHAGNSLWQNALALGPLKRGREPVIGIGTVDEYCGAGWRAAIFWPGRLVG